MAKIAVRSLEMSAIITAPDGIAGSGETRAMFDRETDPIHVYVNRLKPGESVTIGPRAADSAAYVWQGDLIAGEQLLSSGSSIMVERGATVALKAGAHDAALITFAAGQPSEAPHPGGHVHLLPREDVPRMGNPGATQGGLHADASCPTCSVWLHENSFPPPASDILQDPERGVHAHSEDEVIFVTSGQIRLGAKLYGPGTAVAIAANSLYSFLPGPEGLHFINFRPGLPSEIRFASGDVMDEVAYWRNGAGSPRYRTLPAA